MLGQHTHLLQMRTGQMHLEFNGPNHKNRHGKDSVLNIHDPILDRKSVFLVFFRDEYILHTDRKVLFSFCFSVLHNFMLNVQDGHNKRAVVEKI